MSSVWIVQHALTSKDIQIAGVCSSAALADDLLLRIRRELPHAEVWAEEHPLLEKLATLMREVEIQRSRLSCEDCMTIEGRQICTMNCGPAAPPPNTDKPGPLEPPRPPRDRRVR